MSTVVPISLLPAVSNPSLDDLIARVDLTQSLRNNRTQHSTLRQVLTLIQQSVPMVYPCSADPNSEHVAGFAGSVAFGDDGSVWKNQGSGYNMSGWAVIIAGGP